MNIQTYQLWWRQVAESLTQHWSKKWWRWLVESLTQDWSKKLWRWLVEPLTQHWSKKWSLRYLKNISSISDIVEFSEKTFCCFLLTSFKNYSILLIIRIDASNQKFAFLLLFLFLIPPLPPLVKMTKVWPKLNEYSNIPVVVETVSWTVETALVVEVVGVVGWTVDTAHTEEVVTEVPARYIEYFIHS